MIYASNITVFYEADDLETILIRTGGRAGSASVIKVGFGYRLFFSVICKVGSAFRFRFVE